MKWDSIDFERKVFTVRHVVTQTCLNGKSTIIAKDRPKTKSSLRSLPIVQPFEEALYRVSTRDFIRIGIPFTLIAALSGAAVIWFIWS